MVRPVLKGLFQRASSRNILQNPSHWPLETAAAPITSRYRAWATSHLTLSSARHCHCKIAWPGKKLECYWIDLLQVNKLSYYCIKFDTCLAPSPDYAPWHLLSANLPQKNSFLSLCLPKYCKVSSLWNLFHLEVGLIVFKYWKQMKTCTAGSFQLWHWAPRSSAAALNVL